MRDLGSWGPRFPRPAPVAGVGLACTGQIREASHFFQNINIFRAMRLFIEVSEIEVVGGRE